MPWSPFTGAFPEIPALAATEEKKSQSNAEKLLAAFQDSAEKSGVFQDRIVERCQTSEVPDVLTGYARVRDLIIVPVPEGDNIQQWYAESVIFGSGRPVLIIPQSEKPAAGFALDTVVVAWDFSRPASRAVADALPILEKAKRVHVVTVTNEKMIAAKRARNDGRTGMARTFC
jgi:hypothetical protein